MAPSYPRRAALHARYDGPCPPTVAVPRDSEACWTAQIRRRRLQAWETVRGAGRRVLAARRDFRRAPHVESYRLWCVQRRRLARALAGWAACRDLDRKG